MVFICFGAWEIFQFRNRPGSLYLPSSSQMAPFSSPGSKMNPQPCWSRMEKRRHFPSCRLNNFSFYLVFNTDGKQHAYWTRCQKGSENDPTAFLSSCVNSSWRDGLVNQSNKYPEGSCWKRCCWRCFFLSLKNTFPSSSPPSLSLFKLHPRNEIELGFYSSFIFF